MTKNYLNSVATLFGIMGSLVAIFDLIDLLRKVIGRTNLSHLIVLKMLCLRFPMHVQEILPFIILFATILAFWHLNRHSEIIVLRASGLSIWQILSPFVISALIIGFIDLVFISPFSSKMMGRYEFYEAKYLTHKTQLVNLNETGIWLREGVHGGARIYHVDHIDEQKNQMYGLSVYEFDNHYRFLKRYDSKIAQISARTLQLSPGIKITVNEPPEKFNSIVLATSLSLMHIQDSLADPRILPFWKLHNYYKMMEASGLSGQRYALRLHTLLARVLWLAVMVVLAATFSLEHVRLVRTSKLIVFGIISVFLLYFFREMMITLSQVGKIPNVLGVWGPTCITGMFAVTKLLNAEDG